MWFALAGLALANPVPPLSGAGTVPAMRIDPAPARPSATIPWRPTGVFAMPACVFDEGGCPANQPPPSCLGPPPVAPPTAWQLRATRIETPGEPVAFEDLPPAASTIAFEDLAPAAEPVPIDEVPSALREIPEAENLLPEALGHDDSR